MIHVKESKDLRSSFSYALQGILYVLYTQRNMKIHFSFAVIVLLLAIFFNVPRYQLLFVFFSIVFVICMELVNTAIEKTVDLVTDEFHPLAKIAKDVAAGAVFFAAVFSVFVGIYVFLPPVLNTFNLVLSFPIEHIMVILIISILLLLWVKQKKGNVQPNDKEGS